jgi:hypothetical protein
MKKPYEKKNNFICLTCDGVFSFSERVNDYRAMKLIKNSAHTARFPIMCEECFLKKYDN